MIEELMSSLKSQVGDKVQQSGNFSTEKTGKIFSVIGDAAKKQVTKQMLTGNFSDVMNLFSKNPNTKGADNLQNGISSEVISSLTKKLGLPADVSKNIAGIVLPAMISLITKKNSKTPDDDPSPLNEIFGSITGKEISGGMAKNILGKFLKR